MYRQELIQRLRIPPLPNYRKEAHEQRLRERKRQKREEEERKQKREEEERKQKRKEERRQKRKEGKRRMQALESVSGSTPNSKLTGEPSRKRKRKEDDSCYHYQQLKKIQSLFTTSANVLIRCFNDLPDGKARDVPEKWNSWIGELITHAEFQNLIVTRRKRRRTT